MTMPAHSNPTPPIDAHAVHQDAFLSHARAMANVRDRLQASEKIWGAAAHAVIGFAKKRGWPIATRADIRDVGEGGAVEDLAVARHRDVAPCGPQRFEVLRPSDVRRPTEGGTAQAFPSA